MNLLWFLVTLTILGVAFAVLQPLLALPFLGANYLAHKIGRPFFYTVAVLGLVWQMYILVGWSVTALLVTRMFTFRPGVIHSWPYYILGFGLCLAPVMFMASHDYIGKYAYKHPMRDLKAFGILAIAGSGFVTCAFIPSIAQPWWWLLRFL